MTFAELTWTPDNWNEEIGQNMGFQAQYEADNGYLLVVNTQLSEEQAAPDGTPLPSATEAGQLYSCAIYAWNRAEGDAATSVEADCTNNRVDSVIDEVEALAMPEAETDPNGDTSEEPSGPTPQWD